jgi:hypothetical protein
MADEFYIDHEGMRAFGRFIADCDNEARAIEISGIPRIPSGGGEFFSSLTKWHEGMSDRASERMTGAISTFGSARAGVSDAALFYLTTEKENAAKLDATYTATPTHDDSPDTDNRTKYRSPSQSTRTPADKFYTFNSSEPSRPLQQDELNINELTPDAEKVTSIEFWITTIGNLASPYTYITKAIEWLIEQALGNSVDVSMNSIYYSFTGSWEEWAQATARWQLVGDAYSNLAGDLEQVKYVELYWKGNASDAAQAYFKKLQGATAAETPYYNEFLVPAYREVIDITYSAVTVVGNMVQAVVDMVLTLGMSEVLKAPARVQLFLELYGLIGHSVATYREIVRTIAEGDFNTAAGRPEPPCLIERLKLAERPYTHPSQSR